MGPPTHVFFFVLGIVLIVTIGKVLRARMQHRPDVATDAENRQLRDELRALKDRVQVLERVITDNERSLRLDHEIERLRDKSDL